MKSVATVLIALVVLAVVIVVLKRAGRSVTLISGRSIHNLTTTRPRDLKPLTSHLYRDAISVRKSVHPTRSYLGGSPPSSPKLSWPTKDGRALSFLACIDCSELPHSRELDWLPHSGFLLFFYDIEDQVWGFDPKHRGGAATIYLSASDVSDPASTATPPKPLTDEFIIKKRHVAFVLTKLPPSWESADIQAVGLTEREMDIFMEQRAELYGDHPHHQIGGFADPIQHPGMDVECQLVTNGL